MAPTPAPNLNKITTNKNLNGKTPVPKTAPQNQGTNFVGSGKTGFYKQRTDAGQQEDDPRVTGGQTNPHVNLTGQGAYQPTPDRINQIRAKLIQAGYNVAPTGPSTHRLSTAYDHFIGTKGSGAKVWNAHNVQVTHPAVAPGNRVHGPVHVVDKRTPASPALTTPVENLPDDQVPGAPTLPANLQALLDKEFAPYQGDQGQPTILDPKKLAADQANLQYGGAINQQTADIKDMVGAEPGAQANIAKYFAPLKAQSAANIASDDAANAANVAAQAQISPGLASALGLKGADAGGLLAGGKNATDFASNMATLNHSDDLNAQSAADRAEQQAHTTEDANSTIQLSGARRALVQSISDKGNAQSTNEATDRQQNFVNRTQGIANKAAISNLNATNGLAKTNIIQGILQNAGTAQTQDINKRTSDTTQVTTKAQLKQAAANLQQTLINNKRLTQTPIPGATDPNATTKIPFTGINAGDRDTLAAGLWAKFGNLPPAKAEQQLNSYMTSFYGYNSTPAIRAWVKEIVKQHQWDTKDKKYKA